MMQGWRWTAQFEQLVLPEAVAIPNRMLELYTNAGERA